VRQYDSWNNCRYKRWGILQYAHTMLRQNGCGIIGLGEALCVQNASEKCPMTINPISRSR